MTWTCGYSVPTDQITPPLENLDEVALRPFEANLAQATARITATRRFREIVQVMAKHGLLYLFRDRAGGESELPAMADLGERVRLAFEELGPTFIKLGQVLVTRQELLPDEITQQLGKLLDEVPSMPFGYLATVLARELPEGLGTFSSIETDKPIGSASLAQVYRARLTDGRECAIKVVRPGVGELFQADIKVIRTLAARLHARLPARFQESMDLPGLVSNYYSAAMNELDMTEEGQLMEEQRAEMTSIGFQTLHIPEVYQTSKSVLITEFVDGWNLKEFPVDFYSFEERLERMTDLAHYYIHAFLVGNYHADPHASNLLVDRHTRKIVIIDWGMVGRMDALHTDKIFRLLMHVRVNQLDDAVEVGTQVVEPTKYTNLTKLRDEWRTCFVYYVNSNQASKYNWGALLMNFLAIGMKHHCRVPNGLALWAKGFSAAEGTARWLCPEVSYHSLVEAANIHIMRSMLARRFNYRANAALLSELADLVTELPRRVNMLMRNLAWNDYQVRHEHSLSSDMSSEMRSLVGSVRRSAAGVSLSVLAAPVVWQAIQNRRSAAPRAALAPAARGAARLARASRKR